MQSKTSPRRESKCPWGKRESLKVDHCPISQVRGSLGSAEAPRSELRRRTWGGHHSYFSSVCFWLPQVSVAAWRHSLPAVTGLLSGRSAAPRWEHGPWVCGRIAEAPGSAAPRRMGSSWARAPIRVPGIGTWIRKHGTTREAPAPAFCPGSACTWCSFSLLVLLQLFPFYLILFTDFYLLFIDNPSLLSFD